MLDHDRRFVRILKSTLLFVYPCLLLGLKNVPQGIHYPLPLVFGEDGDVALA